MTPTRKTLIQAIEALTEHINDPENVDKYSDVIMLLMERPTAVRAALSLYLHKLQISHK